MTGELFIGLMSGTSLDAIDAAIVSFKKNRVELLHTAEHEFPERLRHQLTSLINEADSINLDCLGRADRELGTAYADAVNRVLGEAGIPATDIQAIGCHGQTIRHQPDASPAFTMQVGDAATLAVATGITVVSDFRRADIALGGQGAPLAPAFHQYAFADKNHPRVVVNIGGIANITVLGTDAPVVGYDTGPGNTLIDYWCKQHLGKSYDTGGTWAKEGHVNSDLLEAMLTDSYFSRPAPKSTGREYFHAAWLQRYLDSTAEQLTPADVQATLTELTARSIAEATKHSAPGAGIYVCGGGANNTLLIERIAAHADGIEVATTSELGIAPDWVEAAAFAWLARARIQLKPGNLPSVTGASRAAVLGALTAP